ncbi:odorant receptor Or1-like [Zophobas morio]|uniref:odorant receptor Or1-like n=1 Tax=Zophobas morio TaxID=2755281 RepID=UPI00308337DF
MTQLVRKLFSLNLSVMRLFGFYPTKNYKNIYRVYAYTVYIFFVVPTPILTSLYLLFGENVDLALVAQNAFSIGETGCFVFKLLQFIRNSDKIRRCIYMVESPIFTNYVKTQEQIMDDCVHVSASWAVVPLFGKEYRLPLDIWLPYDVTRGGLPYILSYIFLVSGVSIDSVLNGAIDPLIGGLLYYAATQIKILKNNLENINKYAEQHLLSEVKSEDNDAKIIELKSKIVYQRLKFCVKLHKTILNFVEEYEGTFTSMVFVQFSASVVVICISCLQLIIVEPFTMSFFSMLIFINAVLMEILFYCYYGTILFEESFSLTTAAYMSEWYEYSLKSKKSLIIFMERCKKPIIVTSGKILDLSLNTFTTILKRSYSLLAVLKNY